MVHAVMGVVLSLLAVDIPVTPVAGKVVENFRAPSCLRCAGRRGVVIASSPMDDVRAVRAGTVSFAGMVAHRLYVVVDISPSVKVTYGWLEATEVTLGRIVRPGDILGRASAQTYLGVRIWDHYVEPLGYLGLRRGRLTGSGEISRVR